MRKAIIVGCNGQDGRLLESLLIKKGYQIVGLDKDFIKCSDGLYFDPININETEEVYMLIAKFLPDEVYYLAAFHSSSEDKPIDNIDLVQESYNINVLALINFLEGIRKFSLETKIFYAASSHIFGQSVCGVQDENTPVNPSCIYGLTKAAGLFACRMYRQNYSVFSSVGILYNHESSFRGEYFVSTKIIRGALNIKNKKQDKLVLGDLKAKIDWGYAPDYVDAMYRILQLNAPEDFIIATGKKHTVLDFVKNTFGYLKLNWKVYVHEDCTLVTKKNFFRIGNPRKLMKKTGWRPSVSFREMIKLLLVNEGDFSE